MRKYCKSAFGSECRSPERSRAPSGSRANRARLVRQQLTESVLLALFGGSLDWRLPRLAFDSGTDCSAGTGELKNAGLDGRVLAFAFGVCFVSGIVSGLIPAFRSVKIDLNSVLKEEGKSSASGSNQWLQVF